jgi:hypothetical protein
VPVMAAFWPVRVSALLSGQTWKRPNLEAAKPRSGQT